MKFEDLYDFPKVPGIYYFRNTENGKYYIGQAQEIRERVLKHKTNFESGYYPDAHLYRAWRKHGIDIFEAGIIEIVDLEKGDERNKLLDGLEKKYIEQYNSYGTGGYNQTRGGDGGIDGYKFTELQKRRISINVKIQNLDGRHRLYFYDIKTGQYGETPSFQIINEIFNRNGRYIERQVCYLGRYIFSKTKERLEEKKKKFFSDEYFYSVTDAIDNKTKDLQEKIDKRVAKIRKEIDDFFAKYGKAKYNRKDNKTKKEALRKLQKADLDAGISKKEYMEKYNIKTTSTFYDHVHKLCPDWEMPESELKEINKKRRESNKNAVRDYISVSQMTEEMREDILSNRMCCSKFIEKYNVSEASFYRYKHKIEDELGIKIVSDNPGINRELVTEEQEQDILDGITTIEYMKKYDVCESTYYEHRKYVAKKHPEHRFKQNSRREKVDIELFRKDIENGIRKREFCLKYNLSEGCYKKYKKIILGDNSDASHITDEQKEDIRNGMTVSEYRKKYNVSKDTFYNHRRLILKPEEIKKQQYTGKIIRKHKESLVLISNIQKIDLLAGMNMLSYTLKYKCSTNTYYKHRKIVIPDDSQRLKFKFNFCGI